MNNPSDLKTCLDVLQSSTVQDVFRPIPSLIIYAGVTGTTVSCTECSQMAGLVQKVVGTPQKHCLFMLLKIICSNPNYTCNFSELV